MKRQRCNDILTVCQVIISFPLGLEEIESTNVKFLQISGYDETPDSCIADWCGLALSTGTLFTCFHHHLIYMCDKRSSRADRKVFNSLESTSAVLDYLTDTWNIDLLSCTSPQLLHPC